VALSGEGADELLAGYGGFLDAAAVFCARGPAVLSGARFQLEAGAWISPAVKGEVLAREVWDELSADAALIAEFERTFDRCAAEVGDAAQPLDAHLRFQRHMNLTGLLQRLDTATMLASVEGRTPFADVEFMRVCESLPMAVKFAERAAAPTGGAPALHAGRRTKLALRHAFAGRVPRPVIERRKASFPLPFQRWIGSQGHVLRDSAFANAVFDARTLEVVSGDPSEHWTYAWPMMNVALWGDRWF
jgi:asparagine synthase (glutamine-hydrolysing)